MAYESRVFIVNRRAFKYPNGNGWVWGENIADVKMSAMGYDSGFKELFTQEIDYKLFIDNSNKDTNKDRYGEHLKYTSVDTVVRWLEKEITRSDYRRLPVLLGLLKGLDPKQWDELQVVHYGY